MNENVEFTECHSDDLDGFDTESLIDYQLAFAFMAQDGGIDLSEDEDGGRGPHGKSAYSIVAWPGRNRDVPPVDDDDAEDALAAPGIAIFSLVDIVEQLKMSGAASTYGGWDEVLSYAQEQMAVIDLAAGQSGVATVRSSAEPSGEASAPPAADGPGSTGDASNGPEAATVEVSAAPPDARAIDPTLRVRLRLARRARACRPSISISEEDAPGNAYPRLKRLLALYDDERGPRRRLLIADDAMIDRLGALDRIAPSFVKVTGVVRRAALLSRLTGTGLNVPPVLLSGPPGVGKSFYCNAVASAIGSSLTKVAVGAVRDLAILGYEPIWKTANTGFVTKALLASDTGSPVILLDELEKAFVGYDQAPLDPLLSLLEPETARSLNDNYLGVPFDFTGIIVFASVNGPEALSEPLRDRFLHLPIARPTRAQMLSIARTMIELRLKAYGGLIKMPDEAVVAALARHPPRRAARIIDLSFGLMAEAGRASLTVEDVTGAAELIDLDADRRGKMGFVPLRVVEHE
ncbi:MAG: AAA family ATPase [Beijerinckiaceae bacterium]|nr:AAA family ATPase [Beijerinckiaceae bacterium]